MHRTAAKMFKVVDTQEVSIDKGGIHHEAITLAFCKSDEFKKKKAVKSIYKALLKEGIIYSKGGEMDFPCSVNTFLYAAIWRT